MRVLTFGLFVIFAFCAPTVLTETVQDRSVAPNLGWMMVRRLSMYNPVMFLAYIRHGCYCGVGKKGDIPVDGVDKCCMEHDACYGKTSKIGCRPKWDIYSWQCDAYFSCSEITCTSRDQCEKTICECDKTFVNCLKQFPKPSVFDIFKNNCQG